MESRQTALIAALLVLVLAALAAWWWLRGADVPAPPPTVPPPPPEAVEEAEPAAPRHPLPDPAPGRDRPELRPLPALDDSDEYFRMDLAGLLGEDVSGLFVSEALIERIVATIDNLPRERLAERIRPVGTLDSAFVVAGQDGSGEYRLAEENYARYAPFVEQFVAADTGSLVELYRRYYPLFQKAYEGLGYPDGYFNDRLVEVIDHLLGTPDVTGPVALTRPHVLYRYVDEDLESLSAGRKLLLRIGPDNRERILGKLADIRERLVAGETGG